MKYFLTALLLTFSLAAQATPGTYVGSDDEGNVAWAMVFDNADVGFGVTIPKEDGGEDTYVWSGNMTRIGLTWFFDGGLYINDVYQFGSAASFPIEFWDIGRDRVMMHAETPNPGYGTGTVKYNMSLL